jgi:hypothetical protein
VSSYKRAVFSSWRAQLETPINAATHRRQI